MIQAPQMLLIGSTGRNSGKTVFACSLIEKLQIRHAIAAAKVTTIRSRREACPRGGAGCGVCASLEGSYCITEETVPGPAKDTQRLLAVGARKVFWLRVLRGRLEEGAAALMDVLGKDTPVVCESNSLRTVLDPGLFLMFRRKGPATVKSSARAVRACADRTVVFDGRAFDIDLDAFDIAGNSWTMRYDAASIILAGGSSARMRQDKSLLRISGRPIIEHVCAQLRPHFKEILVSTNEPDKQAFLGMKTVPDEVPGLGPLMGIASALEASRYDRNFVVACDVPIMDVTLIRRMMRAVKRHDAAAPETPGGRLEPLFAVYRKRILGPIRAALAAGELGVRDVLSRCNVARVPLSGAEAPVNLNTPEDYAQFVAPRGGKE